MPSDLAAEGPIQAFIDHGRSVIASMRRAAERENCSGYHG
jgi:hypothetical protein